MPIARDILTQLAWFAMLLAVLALHMPIKDVPRDEQKAWLWSWLSWAYDYFKANLFWSALVGFPMGAAMGFYIYFALKFHWHVLSDYFPIEGMAGLAVYAWVREIVLIYQLESSKSKVSPLADKLVKTVKGRGRPSLSEEQIATIRELAKQGKGYLEIHDITGFDVKTIKKYVET